MSDSDGDDERPQASGSQPSTDEVEAADEAPTVHVAREAEQKEQA